MNAHPPIRGFIFDLDGTVYVSDRVIPGAVETIAELRRRKLPVVFLSNNSLELPGAYAAKLTRLGIPAGPDDVLENIAGVLGLLDQA